MVLSAGCADRIVRVVGPLSTTRVSGSQTVERMPSCAVSRPATSSRLVSALLRGAGPPNKASIACCCASLGERPAVPATGGARLKSGGTISGAERATANSSGVCFLPSEAHPLVASAAISTARVRTLRMFNSLLGSFLTGQEGAEQQDHYRNADRCVPDIEYQKRAEVAEVQVGEVDDIAVPRAVEDVTERSAQHHAQRELVHAALFAPDPHRDSNGDGGGHRNQHPAAHVRLGVEQSERNAVVLGVSEIEDRQQYQLVAELIDGERPRHHPFRQLVERE